MAEWLIDRFYISRWNIVQCFTRVSWFALLERESCSWNIVAPDHSCHATPLFFGSAFFLLGSSNVSLKKMKNHNIEMRRCSMTLESWIHCESLWVDSQGTHGWQTEHDSV